MTRSDLHPIAIAVINVETSLLSFLRNDLHVDIHDYVLDVAAAVAVIITCLGHDLTDSGRYRVAVRTWREESCESARRYGRVEAHRIFRERLSTYSLRCCIRALLAALLPRVPNAEICRLLITLYFGSMNGTIFRIALRSSVLESIGIFNDIVMLIVVIG